MAILQRLRVNWTGFPGAPGISTFYFTDAALAQTALQAALLEWSGCLHSLVTIQQESSGDTIDEQSGTLVGAWTGVPQAAIVGGYTGTAIGVAGWAVRWETGIINAGTRVRGRTYFVPAGVNAFESNGTLAAATVSAFGAAGQLLIDSAPGNLRVWRRPLAATPAWTDVRGVLHPAHPARVGVSAAVISASVPDRAVVLRSRRD